MITLLTYIKFHNFNSTFVDTTSTILRHIKVNYSAIDNKFHLSVIDNEGNYIYSVPFERNLNGYRECMESYFNMTKWIKSERISSDRLIELARGWANRYND